MDRKTRPICVKLIDMADHFDPAKKQPPLLFSDLAGKEARYNIIELAANQFRKGGISVKSGQSYQGLRTKHGTRVFTKSTQVCYCDIFVTNRQSRVPGFSLVQQFPFR